MMGTPEVESISLFMIARRIRMASSLWPLIVSRITTAVGIFYMRQYIMEVPDETEKVARIDDGSEFGIFSGVIKSALASWGNITVSIHWNIFLLLLLRNNSKHTLRVFIAMLPTNNGFPT